MTADVYLAFRFHGNFYHSYRGDTPDELGFGKDIRIIRHLIETLDELNARGIPVRGTWDFENTFSLERIMPAQCPDIIVALQRRVRAGRDEMQLMSYNNGLISAHTATEFEAAIRRSITNENGSGLHDLFGDGVRNIVRPQEMMFTPVHLKLYRACGVETVSLFYSALPFNGFSNFVPPLSVSERYNPLTLAYPGIDETLTLLPCYNTGDLADHLTLRRWVKQLRRQQLALENPIDLLLLIDMDADDEFWLGYDVPLLKGHFSTVSGLKGLVENVADLDYLKFTTPGEYLDTHAPIGVISIGQDTADGSFDGLSSWAEKWSNHRLWTGLERARILELQTHRLIADLPDGIQSSLTESFEARLKLLSTTHFGMAAPVMNVTREGIARDLARQAFAAAAAAFDRSAQKSDRAGFSLLDYVRGDSTDVITYQPHPSRSLVRLPLREGAPEKFVIRSGERSIPSAILKAGTQREVMFVASFEPLGRRDYTIGVDEPAPEVIAPVRVTDRSIANEFAQIDFDQQGQASADFALRSGVTYAGKLYEVETWAQSESLALGVIGVKRMYGEIALKGDHTIRFVREIMLAAGLPYVYVTMRVTYPRTPDQGYSKGKAQRLQQAWDNRWQEVRPCEIYPALAGTTTGPLRVWKHNYCNHVSSYTLDYGRYSKNVELDSVNNHITHGWLAVSDGARGLLVAQTADVSSGMAFCPLRARQQNDVSRVRFNPFGTYWGKQYHYGTADTGLGNLLATTFSASDHIRSYAPSYNDRVQEFRLLIAPYAGDMPPDTIRHDAEAFAYPYLVLNDDRVIDVPPHRRWDGAGLGQIP